MNDLLHFFTHLCVRYHVCLISLLSLTSCSLKVNYTLKFENHYLMYWLLQFFIFLFVMCQIFFTWSLTSCQWSKLNFEVWNECTAYSRSLSSAVRYQVFFMSKKITVRDRLISLFFFSFFFLVSVHRSITLPDRCSNTVSVAEWYACVAVLVLAAATWHVNPSVSHFF